TAKPLADREQLALADGRDLRGGHQPGAATQRGGEPSSPTPAGLESSETPSGQGERRNQTRRSGSGFRNARRDPQRLIFWGPCNACALRVRAKRRFFKRSGNWERLYTYCMILDFRTWLGEGRVTPIPPSILSAYDSEFRRQLEMVIARVRPP